MNQEIIVYIIIVLTIGLVIYFSVKKRMVKNASVGKDNCGNNGCSGCPLKDNCH